YSTADIGRYLETYQSHLRAKGHTEAEVRRLLMQYGRTNGQLGDLIARLLATDEDIHVPPDAIAVTAGCQEAMVIVLRGLAAGPDDVVLAASPRYVMRYRRPAGFPGRRPGGRGRGRAAHRHHRRTVDREEHAHGEHVTVRPGRDRRNARRVLVSPAGREPRKDRLLST